MKSRSEKKLETIYYSFKGLWHEEPSEDNPEGRRAVKEKKVPVEIWTLKQYHECASPPHTVKSIEFQIRIAEPEFKVTGPDIEALRLATWGFLDERFAVKWVKYLRVVVSDGFVQRPGDGMNLQWEEVEHGTAHDGTLLLRERRYRDGERIIPWPGRFTDKQGRAQACIPATKENEEALELYAAKIGKLRDAVRDTLKPEKIDQTLANFLLMKQLPAPKE